MNPGLQSCLYFGRVRHARYQPKQHRFTYRVFSALLDVDAIDDASLDKNLRWFSLNRFNLFSFFTKDHGAKDASPLRPFIEAMLGEKGLAPPDQMMMMCYPRILGFAFNPITVYYCLYDGKIGAMVYEVRNTFGEDHIYVACLDENTAETPNLHCRDKLFHVSPFIGMEAQYAFSTQVPDAQLRLVIRETQNQLPLLLASFVGQRRPLSNHTLLRAFFQYPLMTVKVLFAIHYEAGKLIFKGVRLSKRPKAPKNRVSY